MRPYELEWTSLIPKLKTISVSFSRHASRLWIDQVEFRQGDALERITKGDGLFDILFCDIDKGSYPGALAIGLPLLKSGGLFIADNVLWSGRVASASHDPDTVGIQTFNRAICSRPELTTTIIPLRDGVSVSMKR